jgi:prepilin-type N-terminal cleavage/methylation domain-containing protein
MARRAFSLVEVLVVIGVISLLIGLLVPVMSKIRAESASTQCLSNLRQLYVGLQSLRVQMKDDLPYAAPLPAPGELPALVSFPSLPERMKHIIPIRNPVWFCPADTSVDSEDLGTSYVYVPGAFMLLEPPLPVISPQANEARVARLITQRFHDGYLRSLPLLADSDDYHDFGSREPRNAVFVDGNARAVDKDDGNTVPQDPGSSENTPPNPGQD